MSVITIKYSRSLKEYRVPGFSKNRNKEEAEAYYTDDKDDALGTCQLMHGVKPELIKIRSVE